MQKHLFAILFIFGFLSVQAQDTIIKKDGETIIAKVFEIGVSEVKYKKFNFEDGPTYISDKAEIRSIHFKNGQIEEFAKKDASTSLSTSEKSLPTEGSDDYVSQSTPLYTPSSQKIEMFGNRYLMNGRRYNEKEIQNHLLGTNDKKIITLVGSARDAKKMQYIGFGAFPLGIAALTVLGKGLYQTGSSSGTGTQIKVRPENAVMAVVCLAATITCPVLSGVYKNRRANYNRAAVKLYNEKY